MKLDNKYRLVTTTDGCLYFGEYSLMESGGVIVLTDCCMLSMYGVPKSALDIAYLGFTEDDTVNITQCASSVSIFNPSLSIEMSDRAIESILNFITRARNKDLIEHGGSSEEKDAFSLAASIHRTKGGKA